MSRISSTLEFAQVRISLYESDFRAGEPLADYERAAKLCERFVVSAEHSYVSIEVGESPAVIAEVSTKEVLQPGSPDQEARERFTVEVLVRQGCVLVSVTVFYGKGPEATYRSAEKRIDQATRIAEVAIEGTMEVLDVLDGARQSLKR